MGDEFDDQLLRCPFNETHLIRPSRWQYHLEKCRKTCGDLVKTAICPFDRRHEVPEEEIHYHMNTCPSRGPIESFIAQECSKRTGMVRIRGNTDMPPEAGFEKLTAESWEGDEDGDLGVPELNAFYLGEDSAAQLRAAALKKAVINTEPAQPLRRPLQQSKAQSFGPASTPGLSEVPNTLGGAGIGRGRQASLECLGLGSRPAVAKPQATVQTQGPSQASIAQNPLSEASEVGKQHRGRGRLMQPPSPAPPVALSPGIPNGAAAPVGKGSPGLDSSPKAAEFPTLQDVIRTGNSEMRSPCRPRSFSDVLKRREIGSEETVVSVQQENGNEHSISSHIQVFPGRVVCGGEAHHTAVKPTCTNGQVKVSENSAWSVSYQANRNPSHALPLGRGRSPASGDWRIPPGEQERECMNSSGDRRQAIRNIAVLATSCKELDVPVCRPEAGDIKGATESCRSPDGSPPKTVKAFLPAKATSAGPVSNNRASVHSPWSPPPTAVKVCQGRLGDYPVRSDTGRMTLLPTPSFPLPAMGLGRGQALDSLSDISQSLLWNKQPSGHGGVGMSWSQDQPSALYGGQAPGRRLPARGGAALAAVGGRGAPVPLGGLGRGMLGFTVGQPFRALGSREQMSSGYDSPTGIQF